MWRLKSCPKCGGDLMTDSYCDYCPEEWCLQCGFRANLNDSLSTVPSDMSVAADEDVIKTGTGAMVFHSVRQLKR